MDGVKILGTLFILISSVIAQAAEVEYISPEKQKQLESMFKDAHFSMSKDAQILKAHGWSCDMYGMRTRLQVQRGLKLYEWNASDGNEWQNSGAQLVSSYKPEATALVGRRDRFEDQVRITKDGQLVSRLSLNTPEHTVLAYSVCKTL